MWIGSGHVLLSPFPARFSRFCMRLSLLLGCRTLVGLLAVLSVPLPAIEIATGSMLGPRYKQDRFYVRSGSSSTWDLTYGGRAYRSKVRGSLALIRVAQGLFDDEWMRERDYDPDANTDRLIEQLDIYKEHGVGGIVVGLQGSNPFYSIESNGVDRGPSADLGEKAGALVSAYRRDGSLKEDWMLRLEKLIKAADRRGMVVCLILFQQDQDEALESTQAIANAAGNIARHLIKIDARNVIVDVADAWDEPEGRWDHRRFIPRYVESLIRAVRDEFQHASFSLPIGASSGSGMLYPLSLAQLCDVVLLQGNGRSASDKLARAQQFKNYGRPVLMVSDSNSAASAAADLDRERAIAEAYLERASGWSYVPTRIADAFPFSYEPADSVARSDNAPHAAYFRAVLEQIARVVLRRPPSTAKRGGR